MHQRFSVNVAQILAKKGSKQRKSLLVNSSVIIAIVITLVTSGCSILTVLILLVSVPVALLASITIISWTFGKPFTARFSSFFIPRAMASIDSLFADIRTELLKDIRGSILDVGCADGPYLKYYNQPGVSKIVFLEPNTFHHPRLQHHIRTMQRHHPSTLGNAEIVVEGRFIEELESSMGATYQSPKGKTDTTSTRGSRRKRSSSIPTPVTPSRLTRSTAKRQQQYTDDIVDHPLVVGESVEYVKPGLGPVRATVVSVHRDDYPHVYYTIRLDEEETKAAQPPGQSAAGSRGREKQTDATYLRRSTPTSLSGGGAVQGSERNAGWEGYEDGNEGQVQQGEEGVEQRGGERGDGFDWIVLGNVLCEVPDQEGVLAHVDRLVRPGGRVYFSEHIAHPAGTFWRSVQDWVNPWWCCVSDGCNVNRPTLDRLLAQFTPEDGWEVQYWQMDVGALVPFVMGVATKGVSRESGACVGVGSRTSPLRISKPTRKTRMSSATSTS